MIKPTDMWSKIYLAVLGAASAILLFFSYYSWSWLQSIGAPIAALEGYNYHSDLAWPVLWISTIVLLFLGNAVLWVSGRRWALWSTFAFFAIFVGIRYFWLERSADQFQDQNALAAAGAFSGPFIALMLLFLLIVIVFFDQFIIEKARPTSTVIRESSETVENETDAEVISDDSHKV